MIVTLPNLETTLAFGYSGGGTSPLPGFQLLAGAPGRRMALFSTRPSSPIFSLRVPSSDMTILVSLLLRWAIIFLRPASVNSAVQKLVLPSVPTAGIRV